MLAVARLAGKVGGLTKVFFTGLRGALPLPKCRTGGLMGKIGGLHRKSGLYVGLKKAVIFLFAAALLVFFTILVLLSDTEAVSLSETEVDECMPAESAPPAEKIAIITTLNERYTSRLDRERYFAAKQLVAKYGEEKIVHFTKPRFLSRQTNREEKRAIFNTIAQDPEIKVLIINSASYGTDYFVSTLRQQRTDIFVIYVDYNTRPYSDDLPYLQNTLTAGVNLADLIINANILEYNNMAPVLAQKMGAKTLVFFGHSYECELCEDGYCTNYVMHNREARMLRTKSREIGLNFAYYSNEECQCGSSTTSFMSENLPKIVSKYGNEVVFLGLPNDRLISYTKSMNAFFIYHHDIYSDFTLPYDIMQDIYTPEMTVIKDMPPERFHATANISLINETIRNELEKVNMLGRVAAVPYSVSAMFTYVCVEYAIKRLSGEAPEDGIDTEILERLMLNYITQTAEIEGIGVDITPLAHENEIFQNFLLVFPEFFVYE